MARGPSAAIDRLNGSEKAAILLLNVGEELAAKVLRLMAADEIQHLGTNPLVADMISYFSSKQDVIYRNTS